MPLAIVTGSGGLIGSEAARYFVEHGYDVVGIDNDMRARFFGAEASTRRDDARARARARRVHATSTSTSAITTGSIACSPARTCARAGRAHGRAAVPRLGGARPAHRLHGQRPRDAQPAARPRAQHSPDATFIFTARPTRSTATRPTACRWWSSRPAGSSGGSPLVRRHRPEMSIDHSTHSLFGVSKAAADLMVQEYGRYFGMPTVCFRGGCLTGPAARRRPAARLPRLPDALHGHRHAVHDLRLQGQAGARQHPLPRRGDGLRRVLSQPALGRRLQHRRRARLERSMLEAIALSSRSPGRSSTTGSTRRRGRRSHWWISDLTEFEHDYPDWQLTRGIVDVLREIHDANVERWVAGPQGRLGATQAWSVRSR